MEAVAIARFLKCVFIWDSCNNSLHRHNWLDNDHIIGRLLKPHMENTIFVNFRARDTLMAETDSYMENYMSVCPCPLLILASLIFLNSILRWGRLEQRSWWLRRWLEGTVRHIDQLRWSKQKSKRACRDHSVGHLTRYNWSAEVFPRRMEERGFHRNKSDGLKEFYYRWKVTRDIN